jgi:Chitobiase/beta-hexosaminidase C-terminal domain
MSDGQILGPSGAGVGLPGASSQFGTPPANSGLNTYAGLPGAASSPVGTPVFTLDAGWVYSNGVTWLPITQVLGTVYITATLPAASLYPYYLAITVDAGLVFSNGISWSPVSASTELIAGNYTFATLPSAVANPYKIAITTDQGPVFSNGVTWLALYNASDTNMAIANNPPLIAGSNGTAYSLQLTATLGQPPYTWLLVTKFATTNAWTLSTLGVLACASPATSALDTIMVQVTDSTGAAIQKLLTVVIAASAGTPAATPTFSPAAGTYTGTQSVTISDGSAGVTIYYTVNGSTPTTSSPVFTGTPVTVSASQTINAIAVGGSFTQSAIGSASYIINATPSTLGFPVSGIVSNGGNQNAFGSQAFLTGAAKYNQIVLGWYLGIEQGILANYPGMTMPNVLKTLKTNAAVAGNPSCKTLLYQIENEWFQTTGDSGFNDHARLNVLNANAYWWLSSNYPGTTHVTSQDGLPKGATNITNTTPSYNITAVGSLTGPGNVNLMQFLAWLEVQQMVLGLSSSANSSDPATTPNPYLDGIMHDNQEQSPYVSGCWLTTPTVYTGVAGTNNAALNTPCAAGYAQLIAAQRALQPNLLQLGNCDNFNYGLSAVYPSAVQGLYDAPMLENPFGLFEQFAGSNFNNLLTTFVNFEVLLNVKTGNYVVGLINGPSASGSTVTYWTAAQSTFAASDWQAWRYQAAIFTMMRWRVSIRNPLPTPVYWFDELDGAGALGVNWMGAPSGARNLTKIVGSPGTYGLFQADFANGSVIINPKNNGIQTINMPYSGSYLGYNGFGDKLVNTGASFTTANSHTFQDRDAIFISRASGGGGGGGGGGGVTQAIVQFIAADVQTSASSTSQAMGTTTAGSTLLALTLTNFTNMAATPVQDTQGNTWVAVDSAPSSAGPGNQTFRLYAAYNIVGGANTVQFNYATPTTVRPILLLEVAGTAAAPLDGHNHNDQTAPGTGVGAVVTGAASNTVQPAMAIGFTIPLLSNAAPAAVAPYTAQGTFWAASTTGRCEYQALTAAGSQQATFTASAGSNEHLSLLIILNHV